MNLNSNQTKTAGTALLVVLMLTGILTLAVGVYLNLTSTENKNVMRSQCWNDALPLAEAGIEEAMSQLAKNTNNYSLDGWTQSGTNTVYLKQRTNGVDYYSVSISGAPNSTVTISSTGAVHFVDAQYISRVVQVTARAISYPSPAGMVAKSFTLLGTMSVDSYDTSDPAYRNTNNIKAGWYDSSKASDQGFLGNPFASIGFGGNSSLLGYAAAGPGFSVTAKGSATVGDKSWNSKGIQPGHGTNGYTMSMPDVIAPFASGNIPGTNSAGGSNYTYYLSGGDYKVANLTSNVYGKSMYVASASRLYVTGDIDLNTLVFASGARLDLYVSQASVSVTPVLIGGAPTQFVLWGLPTCTSIDVDSFIGIIYAPEAAVKAVANRQFYGALTVSDINSKGNFNFHHDLAAGKAIQSQALSMISWDEIYPRQ